MTLDRGKIRKIVQDVMESRIPERDDQHRTPIDDEPNFSGRDLITEKEVMTAHRDGKSLVITPETIVTPSAQDAMVRYQVASVSAPDDQAVLKDLRREVGSDLVEGCSRGQVAIAADHGGFAMKEFLLEFLESEAGIHCENLGTFGTDAVDYPDFAAKVASCVAEGRCCRGIIVDGAGIGSAMVANKFSGVRAAHCSNVVEARNAREHNDANVLTLGGRMIGEELAKAVAIVFLKTDFGGGRHQRRVDKIRELES